MEPNLPARPMKVEAVSPAGVAASSRKAMRSVVYMTGDSCPRCTLTLPDPGDHRLDKRHPIRTGGVPWLRYIGPLNGPPTERSCPVCGFTQRWTGARWETIRESRFIAADPAPVWVPSNRLARPAARTVGRVSRRAA